MNNLKDTALEVVQMIVPISIIVIILQFTWIKLPLETFSHFFAGVVMVGIGLFLFLIGTDVALTPVGEMMGSSLSKTGKLSMLILFGFIIGFASTVAEPHVQVLDTQVNLVSNGSVSKTFLVLSLGIVVGIYVVLGLLRIIFNIDIIKIFIVSLCIIFIFTVFTSPDFVPIAFDAGGIITGPLIVPFIMALGLGVTRVLGGKSNAENGFGLIGLTTLAPILAMIIIGVINR